MPSQSKYVQRNLDNNWTDPANATGAHDGNCATSATSLQTERYDFFGDLFTIPVGSIFDGIEVVVHRSTDDDDLYQIDIQDSTPAWVTSPTAETAGPLSGCASAADETLGGAALDWGGTWTVAHVNSTDFQVRLTQVKSAKQDITYVDYIYVTVHYSAGVVTYTKNFTFDALLQKSLTKEFIFDGWLQKGLTKEFTFDGWLQKGGTKDFTLDGWLQKSLTKEFTFDGWLQKALTKGFTFDAWLLKAFIKEFTFDGILILQKTKDFTFDGWLQKSLTKEFTFDGWLLKSLTQPFTFDGWLRNTSTKAFTLDGWLQKELVKTFTFDGWLQKSLTKPFTFDAWLQKEFTKPFTFDAWLQKSLTKPFTFDALLQKTFTKPFTFDAILEALAVEEAVGVYPTLKRTRFIDTSIIHLLTRRQVVVPFTVSADFRRVLEEYAVLSAQTRRVIEEHITAKGRVFTERDLLELIQDLLLLMNL